MARWCRAALGQDLEPGRPPREFDLNRRQDVRPLGPFPSPVSPGPSPATAEPLSKKGGLPSTGPRFRRGGRSGDDFGRRLGFIGSTGASRASAGRRVAPATDAPGSGNRKGESSHAAACTGPRHRRAGGRTSSEYPPAGIHRPLQRERPDELEGRGEGQRTLDGPRRGLVLRRQGRQPRHGEGLWRLRTLRRLENPAEGGFGHLPARHAPGPDLGHDRGGGLPQARGRQGFRGALESSAQAPRARTRSSMPTGRSANGTPSTS